MDIRRLSALLGLALASTTVPAAQWEGELWLRGDAMPLRLALEETPEGPRALLDLPALLMAHEPVATVAVDGGVSVELPFGIGAFVVDPALGAQEVPRALGEETLRLVLRPGAPPPYARRPLDIAVQGAALPGELYLPPGEGPHPAVVLLHGANATTRASWAYRSWADWFARHGIAALVYDRRGPALENGPPPDLAALAADAVAAVHSVRAQAGIDPARVGLMGSSQGAWVALQAAADLGDLAFLVLGAAPAVPPWRQQLQETEARMRADGRPAADIDAALGYLGLYFHVARTGGAWPELDAAARAAERQPWGEYVDQPLRPEDLGWWRANLGFQPAEFAAKLEMPVLALYGGADVITPPLENADRLPLLFPDPARVTVRVFPGADHRMEMPTGKDAQGQWRWPRMADGMPDAITAWLEAHRLAP